jgi:hypothetical protein
LGRRAGAPRPALLERRPELERYGWDVGYFALGCSGWFTQGLLLGTPLAIPLGVPENLFHLLLSVPALVIVLLQLHSARSHVPERGQARAATDCGGGLG